MSVYAMHDGIQYAITEVRAGEWQWAFTSVQPLPAVQAALWATVTSGPAGSTARDRRLVHL